MKRMINLKRLLNWKSAISIIGIAGLFVFSGMMIVEAQSSEINLVEDGTKHTVKTNASTVKGLLDQKDIHVTGLDKLSHKPDTALKNGMTIKLDHAKRVKLTVDDQTLVYFTTDKTIGAFLDDNDLDFSKHDDLSFDPDDAVKDGMKLNVDKGFQITVKDAGKKKKYWTTGGTVKQFIDDHDKIDYDKKSDDKLKPGLNKTINHDTTIKLTRIKKLSDEVEKEAISYETEKQQDDTLKKGKEKVLHEGKDGEKEKTYKVVKRNGKEKRTLKDETVVKEPKKKVIAIGTKQPKQKHETKSTPEQKPAKKSHDTKPSKASHDEKPADEGGKTMTMQASAYSANCSGCSGKTSTGQDLHANPNAKVVAVDPSVIPLGTKVWVEGYGNAIAADTGGDINGNRIDVHVPSQSKANGYGMKSVKVKVLD